ncbi:MAG: hypothetical protein ACRC5A_15480 [Enterobacteriaceae bacterium]
MLNKTVVVAALLLCSASSPVFATPSQCMEDWISAHHSELDQHHVSVQETWPTSAVARFQFTGSEPNTFCTETNQYGFCSRSGNTFTTLTPIGQSIFDRQYHCGGGWAGCSFTFRGEHLRPIQFDISCWRQ